MELLLSNRSLFVLFISFGFFYQIASLVVSEETRKNGKGIFMTLAITFYLANVWIILFANFSI